MECEKALKNQDLYMYCPSRFVVCCHFIKGWNFMEIEAVHLYMISISAILVIAEASNTFVATKSGNSIDAP